MASPQRFDAIVIGSGQAGTPLSMALANAGLRTAIVEREHVGGTCINEGCTPTKTMVASGRVAYLARRGPDYGVHSGAVTIDMERVRQRKREIVASFRDGSQGRMEKTPNLDLVFGDVRFTGPKSIHVEIKGGGEQEFEAEQFFINAGARPTVPKIDGLGEVDFLDSTSIMELDSVPEHLLVLGGGYVGLEFGQMFRRFGSNVTIVQSGNQLLSREDADVAQEVASILTHDGIHVLLNSNTTRVSKSNGQINLDLRTQDGSRTITGTHLLVATGRMPNSDRLDLSAAGIQTDSHGFITVDDCLQTSAPGIYALGDINGGPAFTHISYDDFRIIRTNLLEKGHASIAGRLVPYTVFIDPQLGRVGLTESEARAQNPSIRVAKMPMSGVARAQEVDETRGFMKVIVDARSDQILGAAILGIEGGEIMAMLQLAMMGKLPYTTLREAIFAHPTLAESLNNLFTHFENG